MKSIYSGAQLTALVVLRFVVGWHFFYEGLSKLINPYWTSAGYLESSEGFMSELFMDLASNPGTLAVVDQLNVWGLILVGLGLMLGGLTRTATVFGILMLLLYYLATPPWPGLEYTIPAEGAYLIINKVLIELCALLVTLFFPTGHIVGLDRLLRLARSRRSVQESYA
jgi:thiosulfate dehydrogenase [quinone] large subunit